MAGNRKHGFMRGNRAGRNGVGRPSDWYCSGCIKIHRGSTSRNKMLDGLDYCDRQYYKIKGA